MFPGSEKQGKGEVVRLSCAVLCLDCEAISSSRGDECPACKGHSLLNLARILGGTLFGGKLGNRLASAPFSVAITIELSQMRAQDLNDVLERLTTAIGSSLAEGRASFHVNVQPTEDKSLPSAA